MFGRRKREQEEAAREAERRALFAELAKRPDTICPFLGMAGSRTSYQESVSDEHRCYAFGDPAELSAEQQQKVCLQPGYGNCPRYLRGVLVIPTEELEALRHPAPPPAPVAAAAAATKATPDRRGWGGLILSIVLVLLIVGVAGGGAYWYLRNQVASSAATGTLPGGTDLSAELLSLSPPEGGSQHVRAQASIAGAATQQTTLIYVLDLSGSTLEGSGCGGDRNHDGLVDSPLDCEIAAATALNVQAIAKSSIAEVGLVGFATDAVSADLSPAEESQGLIAPGNDEDGDRTPDVVEAMESAYSGALGAPAGFRSFTPLQIATTATAFSAGIDAACSLLEQTTTPNQLVVFLSDGRNGRGDMVGRALPCSTPAVFQTFAAGTGATCADVPRLGSLLDIAELTDGTCTAVVDLTQLPSILESVVLPQIVRIQLTLDDDEPIDISHATSPRLPEAGPASIEIDYPIVALSPGEHRLCITVQASDASGTGSVESCSPVDAGGGRLTSD